MDHGAHEGSATTQMISMVALMMAMCAAVPLTFVLLSAIGAPALLVVAGVGAALALCVFGHRFMRH
jgi:hypothetical protein